MNFFRATGNAVPYKSVCTRGSTNDPTSVKKAFSELRCPHEKAYEWESFSKNYEKKFTRAKKCMQRRITEMRKYPARSNANKESRKKHMYPIQVAYTYGKNCARKIGRQEDVDTFKSSTNDLIGQISSFQPNIASYFHEGINASIDDPELQSILQKNYFTPEQWSMIDRYRRNTSEANTNAKTAYDSIIEEELRRNGYIQSQSQQNVGDVVRALTMQVTHPETLTQTSTPRFRTRRTRRKVRRVNAPSTQPNENLNSILAQYVTLNSAAYAPSSVSSSATLTETDFSAITERWYTYIQFCQVRTMYEGCIEEMESDYNGLRMYINKNILMNTQEIQRILRDISNTLNFLREKLNEYKEISEKAFTELFAILQSYSSQGKQIQEFITKETGLFSQLLTLNQHKYESVTNESRELFNRQYLTILNMQKNIRALSINILTISNKTAIETKQKDDEVQNLKLLLKRIKDSATQKEITNRINARNKEISQMKEIFENTVAKLARQKLTEIDGVGKIIDSFLEDSLVMYVTLVKLKDSISRYSLSDPKSLKITKTYWLAERSTLLRPNDTNLV